jgi:hypothetical protein
VATTTRAPAWATLDAHPISEDPMTTTARDIDLTPRARPRGALISLVLAVLAVPGVTMAWDLPAGGLWIGLPLAVAAITVGVGARRDPATGVGGRRVAVAAGALAAACLLFMAVYAIVDALG